jgi:hypothetical protein
MDGILVHLEVDKLRREGLIIDEGDILYTELETVQQDFVRMSGKSMVDYELMDKVRTQGRMMSP